MGDIPSGTAVPHVFVDDLDDLSLGSDDRHHLERVLRVRPGDALTVSDGRGRWRQARFGDRVEPAGDVESVSAPAPSLMVGFALVKGSRPELVVQKLTELAIDVIVPFRAERSVVRWDADKAAHQADRLRRIAREAAMQSRRCWLPRVDEAVDFATVSEAPGVALASPDGDPPDLAHPSILVGPEGGWSPTERSAGVARVRLGPRVLRSETAALAAGALLAGLRDGLVGPVRTRR